MAQFLLFKEKCTVWVHARRCEFELNARWSSSTEKLEREFCEIARSLDGDVPSRLAGSEYLKGTHAAYHGGYQEWDLAPKILDRRCEALLREAAETMYGIMEVTTRKCMEDPSLCRCFGLPDSFHADMVAPRGNESFIPLARADILLDETTGEYWFCEVNTDGTFGFTVADEVTAAIRASKTCRCFEERHPGTTAFACRETWMNALLEGYSRWHAASDGANPETPSLALVDYPESVERSEVEDFVERFRARGVPARFSDIRSLKLERRGARTQLVDEAGPISCVWPRVVTGEMLAKPCAGARALRQAAHDDLAYVVGGPRTWPVAMKTFFAVLHMPVATSFLSPEQLQFVRDHVPYTRAIKQEDNLALYRARARWILKPPDGYNGRDIVAGCGVDALSWEAALRKTIAQGGVAQRYIAPYATASIPGHMRGKDLDPLEFRPAHTMLGLFLFNGRFSGVYSRCGYEAVIGEKQGRLNQGCLRVGG